MKTKLIGIAVTFLLFLLFTTTTSCKRTELFVSPTESSAASQETQNRNMTEFAKALTQSIQVKAVRDFLKTKALQKFGNDYDVFYPLVKNKVLSDGLTFRQHIENSIVNNGYKFSLEEIERNLPLLNILVPKLNKFSAEKWNTNDDIPLVGIRKLTDVKTNQKMKAFKADGSISELDYHLDPNISLIILKDNEAVEIRNNRNGYNTIKHDWIKDHRPILETGGIQYYFSDETMYTNTSTDTTLDESSSSLRPSGVQTIGCSRAFYFGGFDIAAQQAFDKNIYNPICPDNVATVRDYIYYGIDPTAGINSGPLKYNYREYITSIRCESLAGRSRYDDLGEGIILDFDITVFTADRDPIFPLKKRLSIDKAKFFRTAPGYSAPLHIELAAYPYGPLEIAVWNFKRQGDIWKYAIFEYDPSTIITETRTITANLGANFSVGDEKLGGKFGLTASVSQTNTITFSFTNASDDLGEAISYWCDPVIKEKFLVPVGVLGICGWYFGRPWPNKDVAKPVARSYDIGTGLIAITVEPRTS